MADLRIDSHKLIFHPQRVADWYSGKNIYPIYVEVAPAGSCNHRCIFCALDYIGYQPNQLDQEVFLRNLEDMAQKGVKSIMFAGEGEPLLNQHTPEFATRTKEQGIDVSMTTNGVLFKDEVMTAMLPIMSWVRISLNAGNSASYDKIHRGRSGDFEVVLENLRQAVAYKREKGLSATIGVQMLLIPENKEEVLELAEELAEIGVDYFSVKPYSQHPLSASAIDQAFRYTDFVNLEEELKAIYGNKLQIAFRTQAMKKLSEAKPYTRCLGLPFWAYIDAKARLWACSAYLGKDEFCYGDLHEATFEQIWESTRRKEILLRVEHDLDVQECREICRMDEINSYLHELKHPGAHANFI